MEPNHDFIEKCPSCGKFMTAKQMKLHKCDNQEAISIKEIPVRYCYQLTEENGEVTIIAHGLDGTLYRLVEKKLSDDGYHEPSNRRKVNRTLR
jgi:hypothetical protein